jgi:hypothetical protein
MAFVLEHFAAKIAAMENAGMPLDLHRLARLMPVAEWRSWYGTPERARLYWEALRSGQWRGGDPYAGARASYTAWAIDPRVTFPEGVPLQFLDSYALLAATRRRHLRKLIATRWSKTENRRVFKVKLRSWPGIISEAAETVADHLTEANRERTWLTTEDEWGFNPQCAPWPVQFNVLRVLHMVLAHPPEPRGVPARSATERKRDSRRKRRQRGEYLFGDRCHDCQRGRVDGIKRFHIDHENDDGGGRDRPWSETTDGLYKRILDYERAHPGQTPPGLRLRCASCHGRRHRLAALAAGQRGYVSLGRERRPREVFRQLAKVKKGPVTRLGTRGVAITGAAKSVTCASGDLSAAHEDWRRNHEAPLISECPRSRLAPLVLRPSSIEVLA